MGGEEYRNTIYPTFDPEGVEGAREALFGSFDDLTDELDVFNWVTTGAVHETILIQE